jgi:hypothetical protein
MPRLPCRLVALQHGAWRLVVGLSSLFDADGMQRSKTLSCALMRRCLLSAFSKGFSQDLVEGHEG